MSPSSTRISATEIRAAGAADIPACRELFLEYEKAIGVSLCFQGFAAEVAGLPGDYVPPRGGLWLATAGDAIAGCVALRPLGAREAEVKRLYVRTAFRGLGLGRRLALLVIETARSFGYETLKLDTLPTMTEAQRLYGELGFVDTAPYNDNPIAKVRFMSYALRPLAQRV
jgi:ribosomal protein S18 acetylase RimI-like enzyme